MAIECKNLTNGLRIATNGTYFACCHTFNAPFKNEKGWPLHAHRHSIEDALNSHTRQEMLQSFENDIRHPACKVCWDAEDAGFQSKRQRDNTTYWKLAPTHIKDKIFFLELNLGNTCNLACRICHVSASSKWREYHRVNEPQMTDKEIDAYAAEFSRSFTDDSIVWSELKKIIPDVQQIDVYGGEPMLMKKQWEILDYCVKTGLAKKQQMSFNTNGTIITDKYVEILSSFKYCRIGFSIDGVGDRFHYLRYPGDWSTVNFNIKKWLEKTAHLPKETMVFELACTISALNALYIFEIVDYVIENKIKLFVSFVYNPVYLSVTNCPDDVKQKLLAILEPEMEKRMQKVEDMKYNLDIIEYEYLKATYRQAKKVIDTIKLPNKSNLAQWIELRRQTLALDEMRGENFSETFPEAEEIFQMYGHTKPNLKINKTKTIL